MMGASMTFIVTHLAGVMPAVNPGTQVAYAACIVGVAVYSIALIATRWLPEPPEHLDE
ncbi:MAG: hypothetical protein WDO18_10080 [Acidobacteriota bacterium]